MDLILIVLCLPLLGFLVNGLLGKRLGERVVGIIGSGVILFSFVATVMLYRNVAANGAINVTLFEWISVGDMHINFGFLVDQLSVWMMMIITGIGFLIHVYSIGYMHNDAGFHKFFSYLNLFILNMLFLVMGANYLILFIGWEGVGLCSYLLIGFWYKNESYGKAARKAFIMNRIGDLGLLLGIFLIFQTFGSIDYQVVFGEAVKNAIPSSTITVICILLFIGAMGKSAQLPLYTWLPDAMAGPTPVSALIHAATMVTAGIYMVVRSNILYSLSPAAQSFVLAIGLATALFAAIIGLRQNDIKKILAYSTVSQLGFMFIALGCGAYSVALFHVTTHAFFKALLFLGAGSVIHGLHHEQDIRLMGGLRKKMPITFFVMLLGTLAIIGIPPFSGFFSKDEILLEAFKHNPLVYVITLISAILTAIYMLRMLFITFFGKFKGDEEKAHHIHESPWVMLLPLLVLAFLSVFGGWLNAPEYLPGFASEYLHHWLSPMLLTQEHGIVIDHSTELMMNVGTVLAVVIVGIISYVVYALRGSAPVADSNQAGLTKLIANKFYVDEIYDFIIVRPIEVLSTWLHKYFDMEVLDGLVNGVGKFVVFSGSQIRKIQNGNTEYYLVFMVLGAIVLLFFGLVI